MGVGVGERHGNRLMQLPPGLSRPSTGSDSPAAACLFARSALLPFDQRVAPVGLGWQHGL
jgi:hypothetical protein